MIDKVAAVVTFTAITFVGLAALPYLLWRVWDKTIPFKGKGRHPDFDLREPKSAE